jgi:predicted ATPase
MMQRSVSRFGELLRCNRLGAGFTQEGLAEAAALSREAVSALERGGRQFPRADTVELLANALSLVGHDREALRAAAVRPSVTASRTPKPAAAQPAPAAADGPRMPVPLTPLIGREIELAHGSTRLVNDKVRLLTITGPAGVGKSRLALELAWDCREAFADGAVFIDVAAVHSADKLGETLAQTFGMSEVLDSRSFEDVISHLRDRNLLLVLDNFEHLLGAAPSLAEVLAACPAIAVVVTSRGILHVRGEELLAISPMFVPQPDGWASLEELARGPAVALFVARAEAVRPDFRLTEANADDVVAICRRLDGLPLALELAALRTRLLLPGALLRRLERRLPTLTDGARDLPERHRTLRAALAWSYELLAPRDQALFRCLSLFQNSATLHDIAAVWRWSYGADAQTDDDSEILEGLTALANQGLLRHEEPEDGEPRVAMLETIREYGLELLIDANELDSTVLACTNHYLAQLEAGEVEPWWPTPAAGRRAWPPVECLSTDDVFARIG